MTEEKEGPVHYQVSVTGRQAAAFFLVLLASLGLSFFFGMKTGAAATKGPDRVSALAAQSDIPVPTASADEGYISANGTTWEDASLYHNGSMSVCLKAFTKTVTITPSVTQGAKGSGGGCSAASFAPLALLLFVPLFLTRK